MKGELWVVCFGTLGRVSEWGKVKSVNGVCVDVEGETGGWDSPYWQKNYVEFHNSKESAEAYFKKNYKG